MASRVILAFDVGARRVGVARAVVPPRIAAGIRTLINDDAIRAELAALYAEEKPDVVVVGRPRNQAGETTAQTEVVEAWAEQYLEPLGVPVDWQDESLTSVHAERQLEASGKPYAKADIDRKAAELILIDYLEESEDR
ncbi:Holliday junction resolvase RuvX [Candidatus Saccharibacteria bacterium]|nr:Holliday junction resolvase RuvX [Candidatus Saccharibacteria bacterium]